MADLRFHKDELGRGALVSMTGLPASASWDAPRNIACRTPPGTARSRAEPSMLAELLLAGIGSGARASFVVFVLCAVGVVLEKM